jgi:heptose I phosphotransferase
MFDFRWVHPEERALVAAHRLDDLEAVLARRDGEPVGLGHRGRQIVRLRLAVAGDASRTFYLKRETGPQWKDLASHVAAGRGLWTKVRAEFETLWRLAAAGIHCPRPVVCLQSGAFPPQAALVLEELKDAIPLAAFLGGGLHESVGRSRERFFATMGCEVARLHATGFNQPDLVTKHIFVTATEGSWKFSFLDFQRSVPHPVLRLRTRMVDLAALWATLPPRLVGSRDRIAFFEAYLAASHLENRAAEVAEGVEQRIERLLARRKFLELRENPTAQPRRTSRLEPIDGGRMWVDRDYQPQLEEARLAEFDAVMSGTNGRLMRALRDRENWRLELHGPHAQPSGVYLKKHHVRGFEPWLRAKVGAGPGSTAGRVEARNVTRLGRAGIDTMRIVAYGEKLHPDGLLESFFMTEELAGYLPLDDFLKQRFPAMNAWPRGRRDPDLACLLCEVAALSAKFHRLGYNHRDLYCCHFFVKEPQRGRFEINLIDLQRVQYRRHFRGRWLVKDLAQLAYSAPRDRISCAQKMAFIRHYLGVERLRPEDKRFIRQVLSKKRRMERRLGIPT